MLDRWNGLLERGLQVGAVGGGDTHTVSRISPFDIPGTSSGRQKTGNIDELGLDGRARTYVLGPELSRVGQEHAPRRRLTGHNA